MPSRKIKKNQQAEAKAELVSEKGNDALIAPQNTIEESNTATTRQLEPVLIGAGGFAREIFREVKKNYDNDLKMYVDDAYWVDAYGLYKISEFDPKTQSALIAVGNPAVKKQLFEKLPENTIFWNYISPRAYIGDMKMGRGNFICAGVISKFINFISYGKIIDIVK
jgi:hypothetical protein